MRLIMAIGLVFGCVVVLAAGCNNNQKSDTPSTQQTKETNQRVPKQVN